MRRISAVLGIALVLLLVPGLVAQAQVLALLQISSDPYTNADSQHQTQVEPDTFAFGNTVVAAFQSGRFFDGGASNNAWATSTDSGSTWSSGFLPGTTVNSTPPGPYARLSDPSVAYDAKHAVWLIASLALESSGLNDVIVSRSTDGGLTWGNPVTVVGSGLNDKSWIRCDNSTRSSFYGNCYVSFDDFGQGDRLYMSTSSDGGLTWSAKISPSGNPTGIGAQTVVQRNGRVIVPAANAFGSQLIVYSSINGGVSWSRARTIASVTSHLVAGGLRAPTYLASADVDAAGKIYLVWADCRFRTGCSANDIVMTTSSGSTWSTVARIPIDPTNSGVDHFIPGIVASGGGRNPVHLALTYYFYPNASCSFSTCQLSVGFISSIDGGVTWSTPQTLAGPMSLSWIADTNQGGMVGDYISTSLVGSSAIPVFSLASAPVGGLFQQASWSDQITVSAANDYPLVVTADPVLSTQGDAPVPTRPLRTP